MEEEELIPLNIGNINDGAVIEGFDIMLDKILANIADINTPATSTRSIVLTIDFKPHSDRTVIETEVKCTSKLAPLENSKSKCFIGRTEEGGMIAFDRDPRQQTLWKAPKPKELPPVVKFGTGGEAK